MPRNSQPHHGRHGHGHGHSRHQYSHVEQASRWTDGGLPIRPGTKECKMYRQNGSCSFGSNCRFSHDKAPASRPTTPLTPLVHQSPLSSLPSAGSQVQQLGSPMGKSGGLVYSGSAMGLGKGFSSLLLEQQHNVSNNGASLNSTRGQNNGGSVESNCIQQNGGSNGHRSSLVETGGMGGPDPIHLNYQNGGGFPDSLGCSAIASGVMGYTPMPILDFGSNIQEHYLTGPIQQMQGYQSTLGVYAEHPKDASHLLTRMEVGNAYLPVSGPSKNQTMFYSGNGGYLGDMGCVDGSGSLDLQYVQAPESSSSMNEGVTSAADTKSPKGPPPAFQESEYQHKGYFCCSWPYVPNPWHPPGVPNKHMQLQLQTMQSPRSKGPVSCTAFLLKPERKEHQEGPGYLAPKKMSPGKRNHSNANFRTPHAVQLMAPQSS